MINPVNNDSNILNVIRKLVEVTNTPQLKQLTSAQRNLIRTIIQDNGYNWPQYEKAHKEDLNGILNTLYGRVVPRKETWGANFMRWLKTFFGFRISSDNLKKQISNINPDSLKNQITNSEVHTLLTKLLPNPLLSDDLLSQFQILPKRVKTALTLLIQEHLTLLAKPTKNPDYSSLINAYANYINQLVDFYPDFSNRLFKDTVDYLMQQHVPNTQDAFTAFETNAEESEKERLNNNIQGAIKSTEGPGLEKEHSWAKEGFKKPHTCFNFWLKVSLEDTEIPDIYNMKFESRINGKDALDFKEIRTTRVKVDLNPFIGQKGKPLRQDQKNLILAFLRKSSSQKTNQERFKNIDFLSEKQKTTLDQLHEQLLIKFAAAMRSVHQIDLI